MKIGDFEIPDVRLIPTSVDTLGDIYKVKKRDRIQSKDLAIFLGFKYGTEPHFYRKIHSLTDYGLMEGKGIFQISELGEKLLHPRDEHEKVVALTNAVLNVPLWKEIYQKHGKKPRDDNFWAVLVDITKIDPESAKNNATKILGWYLTDIAHVSDDIASSSETPTSSTESLRSSNTKDNRMSQQMVPSAKQVSDHIEEIPFGDDITIRLPKKNIEKAWEFAQEYMKVYLKKRALLNSKESEGESANKQN